MKWRQVDVGYGMELIGENTAQICENGIAIYILPGLIPSISGNGDGKEG